MTVHEAIELVLGEAAQNAKQLELKGAGERMMRRLTRALRYEAESKELYAAIDILRALPGDLDALRAAVGALIAETVIEVGCDIYNADEYVSTPTEWFCMACHQHGGERTFEHAPGCPVDAARAALARMEGNAR